MKNIHTAKSAVNLSVSPKNTIDAAKAIADSISAQLSREFAERVRAELGGGDGELVFVSLVVEIELRSQDDDASIAC